MTVSPVFVVLDECAQVTARTDRVAVDRDNHVAACRDPLAAECDLAATSLDTCLLGAVGGVYHQQPVLVRSQSELLTSGRTELGKRDRRHAQQRMSVIAVLDELRHHSLDDVDRDGKADAFITTALRENGAANADHLAFGIEQRATRIAGVDRRVGLNGAAEQVQLLAGQWRLVTGVPPSTDDALGDRLLEPEWRTDSDGGLADRDLV